MKLRIGGKVTARGGQAVVLAIGDRQVLVRWPEQVNGTWIKREECSASNEDLFQLIENTLINKRDYTRALVAVRELRSRVDH